MNNLLICKGISKNSCSFLAFLLFTFILIVPAAAQTLKEHDITLRVQNEPVESVFNKISKQTNFKFLYDQETVNKAPRVSFDIKNASLKQILGEITTQAKLYFNRTDHTIAVSKQPLKKEETVQRTRTIQGIVADDKGEPVIGASVQIKGEGSGTITDIDGRYSIMNVPESATLTISYIGYKTVNISAKDKNTAKITLVEDSKMIDEVVVVGVNTAAPKLLLERCGFDIAEAGIGSSVYFAFRTIGAFVGTFLLARVSGSKYFRVNVLVAIAALVVLFFVSGQYPILVSIALIGFTCSSIFSLLFSMAIQAQPRKANEISGLMVTGIFGGAVIPPLMGYCTDLIGTQVGSLVVILGCLLYLLYCSVGIKTEI